MLGLVQVEGLRILGVGVFGLSFWGFGVWCLGFQGVRAFGVFRVRV